MNDVFLDVLLQETHPGKEYSSIHFSRNKILHGENTIYGRKDYMIIDDPVLHPPRMGGDLVPPPVLDDRRARDRVAARLGRRDLHRGRRRVRAPLARPGSEIGRAHV